MADTSSPSEKAAEQLQYLLTSVVREGNFFGGGKQFRQEIDNTIIALTHSIRGPLQQQITEQAHQIAQLQAEVAELRSPPDAPDTRAL